MAETKTTTKTDAAVTANADHDRVSMLSIAKDGTLDQFQPEIIGDKDAALEATKEQLRQRAVAAVDAEKRPELGLGGAPALEVVEDKSIGELKKAHEAAEKSADSTAESLVNSLHKG